MRNLYQNDPQNSPRLNTDRFFADYGNVASYEGFIDKAYRFAFDKQISSVEHWRRFVNQFREDADYEAGWRGEYWGKMMRGATFVYSYLKDKTLYSVLADTVRDMISAADSEGRISSYAKNHEFDGWDMWCRKYVLLGMQYFYEICEDEALRGEIVSSMTRQVDYIISKIGDAGEGKKPITSATRHWRGLNACSILEPIVRLYSLTGEKRYFDFATYIVDIGACDVENIFELALRDELMPYQYPVTKAYEMTSCFEGLLEYYRIVGKEEYKTAIINYADRVLETDFTVIGCAGCTHELFDHSTVRQANSPDEDKAMQETCVTVTLMKFFYQLNLLTGDPKYADAFERSLYNAYLGAFNTEGQLEAHTVTAYADYSHEPMPFDSYSPLTVGKRGYMIGGFKRMSDNHYYGCCACIGSAGIGLVNKLQLLSAEDGFALNLYIAGSVSSVTPAGNPVKFDVSTDYPRGDKVRIKLSLNSPEEFTLRLRNPAWSLNTTLTLGKEELPATDGYIEIRRVWQAGDELVLTLDMRTQAILPIPYGSQVLMNKVIWGKNYVVPAFDREDPMAHRHIALRRGPIMLAQDSRLGYDPAKPISVLVGPDGYVDVTVPDKDSVKHAHILEARVPLENGKTITLTDYSSAGKIWTDSIAVWLLTK